jgi:hypothetical protein
MAEDAYDNYGIITHGNIALGGESRVLLLPCAAGWTLPRYHATEALDINRVMRGQLGLDVTVLRRVYDRARYEPDARHQVYALENHSPAWTPPAGAMWADREDVTTLALAVPEHRAALDAWFAEAASGVVPAERAPWARPGWFATAGTWIREHRPPRLPAHRSHRAAARSHVVVRPARPQRH